MTLTHPLMILIVVLYKLNTLQLQKITIFIFLLSLDNSSLDPVFKGFLE